MALDRVFQGVRREGQEVCRKLSFVKTNRLKTLFDASNVTFPKAEKSVRLESVSIMRSRV